MGVLSISTDQKKWCFIRYFLFFYNRNFEMLNLKTKTMSKFKINIVAGPLWSNDQAQKLGGRIAAAHLGKFTGQWSTIVEGEMSVIEVEYDTAPSGDTEYTLDVLAGPIWSNDDAKEICPSICASYGGTWNGQWTTVVEGKMSVCGCVFKF
jgi:hypothetical protein